jgi:hypothetical protein
MPTTVNTTCTTDCMKTCCCATFSTLTAGVPLTNLDQAKKLSNTCSMSVTTPPAPGLDRNIAIHTIHVFDSVRGGVVSQYILATHPDLGHFHNRDCGPISGQWPTNGTRDVGVCGKPFLSRWIIMVQMVRQNPLQELCDPLGKSAHTFQKWRHKASKKKANVSSVFGEGAWRSFAFHGGGLHAAASHLVDGWPLGPGKRRGRDCAVTRRCRDGRYMDIGLLAVCMALMQ